MIETRELTPGVVLRHYRDSRFKQGCLSFQLIRKMAKEEAGLNALLPAVLLRGTRRCPDLRAITEYLDTLYGASISPLVRRVGDYQTVGLYCGFMDDRFALPGDRVLAPMLSFLEEVLTDPLLENGTFSGAIMESEKKNLMATIESELNDKRTYAMGKLLKIMCAADSFGVPRLGEKEQAAAVTSRQLYDHYQKILKDSPVEIFYVGSAEADLVEKALESLVRHLGPRAWNLDGQAGFCSCPGSDVTERLDVAQGKLCMGFVTPITNRCPEFPAMQLLNTIFGSGMTSKLFMNVREKMSLCYYIGSGYYGTKGILAVSAGIDFDKEALTRQEILNQLDACRRGEITRRELEAARAAVLSSLRATHDSPGAIEGFYATAALSGLGMTPQEYMEKVEQVTLADVVAAANTVQLHTTYFLKGESQ